MADESFSYEDEGAPSKTIRTTVTHWAKFPPSQRITDFIKRNDCYDDEQRVFDYTDCDKVPGCWAVTPILPPKKEPKALPLPKKTFDMNFSSKKPIAARVLKSAGQFVDASLTLLNTLKGKKAVPGIRDPLCLEGVEYLAAMIRNREVSCEKVINAYIARIARVDPVLNCITKADFDGALKEAKRADKLIKQMSPEAIAKAYPLLGVPFCVPENVAIQGLPISAGMLVKKDHVAAATFFLIDRVRRMGAIFLAQTNVAEYSMSVETDNPVYGRTGNPYDPRRAAGGDWGGAAALLAAGGCAFAIGLELTGSCRISAAFCGIYAHTVPLPDELVAGAFEPAVACNGMAMAGVQTKYPGDLPFVLHAMRGPGMKSLWGPRHYFSNVNFKKVRLVYMLSHGGRSSVDCPVDATIKNMLLETFDWMSCLMKLKYPKEVKIPYLDLSFELFINAISRRTDEAFLTEEMTGRQWRKNAVNELLKSVVGCSEHTPSLIIAAMLQDHMMTEKSKILRERLDHVEGLLKQAMTKILKNSILFYPTYPMLAPYSGLPIWCYTNFAYSAIFNVLKFPSTHVTIGHSSDGRPVGIQMVTSQARAHEALVIAQELQKVLARVHWQPPANSVPFRKKGRELIKCPYYRFLP